jgi:hypothetical protein
MSSGKSYRAIFPRLSDDELQRLQEWSDTHCATSVLLRDGGQHGTDCVVWLATRERPRPRDAFMRSIRATLKKLDIDPKRLRGTWLVLADDDVVSRESRAKRAECMEGPALRVPVCPPRSPLLPNEQSQRPPVPQEDGDEKIIHLTGSARRTAGSGIQVVKV